MAGKGLFSQIGDFLEPEERLEETKLPSPVSHRYLLHYIGGVIGLVLALATVPLYSVLLAGLVPVDLPLGAFTFLPLAILPLLYIIYTDALRRFNMFHFTDRKVVYEHGILNKQFETVHYEDIVDTSIDQRLVERFFDIGHLLLSTAGTSGTEIRLYGIKNPKDFKVNIDRSAQEGKAWMEIGGDEGGDEGGGVAEDEFDFDDTATDTQVDDTADTAAGGGGSGAVSEDDLEKRLVTIEQQKEQLEQQHQQGQLSEEEYRKRWFILDGRKQEVMEQLGDGGQSDGPGL